MNCDILMTNLGGPKEYYNGMAKIINPYNVDEIGRAIRYFLDGNSFQPELGSHIRSNYCLQSVSKQLVNAYRLINNNP